MRERTQRRVVRSVCRVPRWPLRAGPGALLRGRPEEEEANVKPYTL